MRWERPNDLGKTVEAKATNWPVIIAYLMFSVATAHAAPFTITLTGAFRAGSYTSNNPNATLFGFKPGQSLIGIPGKVTFTVDDTLANPAEEKSLNGIFYASSVGIPKTATSPTRFVTAMVSLGNGSFEAGGQFSPDITRPFASRELTLQGNRVTRSQAQVGTSEKRALPSPLMATKAVFSCLSSMNAPFTTDYRWNSSFTYTPTGAAQRMCTATILYQGGANEKTWQIAQGVIEASLVEAQGSTSQVPGTVAAPHVFFRDGSWRDVTSQRVSVVAGQKIELCAAPTAAACEADQAPAAQQQSWEIIGPARAIADYTPRISDYTSGKVIDYPDPRKRDNVLFKTTFYWVTVSRTPQHAPRATGRVALRYTLAGGRAGSYPVDFEVLAPTPLTAQQQYVGSNPKSGGDTGIFSIVDEPNRACGIDFKWHAHLGQISRLGFPLKFVGLGFYAPAHSEQPAGDYHWRQVVDDDTNADGKRSRQKGLDNDSLWYYARPPEAEPEVNLVSDSAGTLLAPHNRCVTRTFKAGMYLMWQSTLREAIPVPIKHYKWGYTGAEFTQPEPGRWKANGAPLPLGEAIDGEFPTWDVIAVNGKCHTDDVPATCASLTPPPAAK